jgi:FdhE protein
MTAGKWDRRIRRAGELASTYPFAAAGLRYYARIVEFQTKLYADFQHSLAPSAKTSGDQTLRQNLDLFLLLPRFPEFLSLVERIAPVPLRQAAAKLADQGSAAWQRAMREFWHADGLADFMDAEATEPTEHSLAWIFLQPYAESLADCREIQPVDGAPLTCPLCGALPIVGVLRAEGDGAKKSLICMLCAHEWNFRRLLCPACAEEREPQLAFYSAPEIPHVRVDVCDSCHTYLKTVDLTKTGLAIPVVDELATMPLDLWARDHGYHKLQINLLGT